jgi:hypothetical protein
MSTGDGNCVDHFGAQFIGKLTQLLAGQGAQVSWSVDRIE